MENTTCKQNFDKSASNGMIFFNAVVTTVACFAACTVYKMDLIKLGVSSPRFLRQFVGPPRTIQRDWPWHKILHDRNAKVKRVLRP